MVPKYNLNFFLGKNYLKKSRKIPCFKSSHPLQDEEAESRRLSWRASNAVTSPQPIRRNNFHNKRFVRVYILKKNGRIFIKFKKKLLSIIIFLKIIILLKIISLFFSESHIFSQNHNFSRNNNFSQNHSFSQNYNFAQNQIFSQNHNFVQNLNFPQI